MFCIGLKKDAPELFSVVRAELSAFADFLEQSG